jgi:AraC-like DNA-binding protein/quercetin dioxygenase-like cupin family protein
MPRVLRSRDYFPHPGLPLRVQRVPVERRVEDHAHEFHELVYVARGTATHAVARPGAGRARGLRTRYGLIPGDCFLVAPDERHAFEAPRNLVVYNLLFLPELLAGDHQALREIPGLADFLFLEPLFRRETSGDAKLHLAVGERGAVQACLDDLVGEFARREAGFVVAARARFLSLLVLLARAWHRSRSAAREAPVLAAQHQAVEAAVAFMDERHGEELSLDAIAAQVYLSPHYFSALFSRQTGLSPWQYLTRVRIDRARHLLRAGSDPISAIARAVGFSDGSYFTRVFRAQVGQTPRAYRAAAPLG